MTTKWYYAKGAQRNGPVTEQQLHQLAASGQLQPTDLVWRDGMAQWHQAESIQAIFPQQPKAGRATQATQPAGTPADWRLHLQKPLVIGLSFLVCWPVGLVLIGIHPQVSPKTKKIVFGCVGSLVVIVMILGGIASQTNSANTPKEGSVATTGSDRSGKEPKIGSGASTSGRSNIIEDGDPSVDFDRLDFDSVDLSRGPQGQSVEVKHELDGQITNRGYTGRDGKWYNHGRQMMLDLAGKPGTEGTFVYGRRHGPTLFYDDSHTVETAFANGQIVKRIVWYDRNRTRKIEEETFSNDGKQMSHYVWERDGTLLMRSENGKIIE